jgi:hypothetical protein
MFSLSLQAVTFENTTLCKTAGGTLPFLPSILGHDFGCHSTTEKT